MKKLLLVLLVVALASFLLVGCFGVPDGTEGEGEGEGEVEICPTVAITSQVAIEGKTYIKGGVKQTITVTFAVPTEPIAVWIGGALRAVMDDVELVVYPNADKTVYTGTFVFGYYGESCSEAYIYVDTCAVCSECKYPYIVDSVAPEATVEVCLVDCTCAGCEVVFSSDILTDTCDPDEVLCDDDCSGFASWSVDIYDRYPFDECCEVPCYEPIESASGVCPIDFTTTCLTDGVVGVDVVYAVVTLVDNVGNSTKFGADIEFNPDSCDTLIVTPWLDDLCVNDPAFTVCAETSALTTTTLMSAVAK